MQKQFTVINESFPCKNCGHENPKLDGGCRNHCQKCLHSLHVDKDFPGDRKSECHNLMKPVQIDQNKKKGWIIIHKCTKCGKRIPNKAADDDNFDKIIELSQINE
jgi:DNA-directed RNA polymerase subunit RPC12/RpoP